MPIAVITVSTNGTVGDLNDIFTNTNPQLANINIQNYLAALASGSKQGSFTVDVHTTDGKAYGTLTCANVAASDDVVISTETLTAVDKAEKTQVTCRADSTGDLNDTYFVFYDATGTKYYMWYNVNSAGTDPEVADATGIEVAVATDATAAQVAAASRAKFLLSPLSSYFYETGATDKILFQNLTAGATTNTADGAGDGATDFTIATTNAGGAVGTDEFQIGIGTSKNAVSATNLGAAITANATLATLVTNSVSSNVVTVTAIGVGPLGNLIELTASGGVTESGSTLSGGTADYSTTYNFN